MQWLTWGEAQRGSGTDPLNIPWLQNDITNQLDNYLFNACLHGRYNSVPLKLASSRRARCTTFSLGLTIAVTAAAAAASPSQAFQSTLQWIMSNLPLIVLLIKYNNDDVLWHSVTKHSVFCICCHNCEQSRFSNFEYTEFSEWKYCEKMPVSLCRLMDRYINVHVFSC